VVNGIYVIDTGDYIQGRCVDYKDKDNNKQGYIKQLNRTAKQNKSLMGFTQNY